MKHSLAISLIALAAGMMWGVTASAATTSTKAATAGTFNLVGQVASGCTMPKANVKHNEFYIDPVNGKITNNGSKAAPWSTLSEVANKKLLSTVVKPGDTVYLMSGKHGSAVIKNMHNADFITIAAAPGQKPVLDYLYLSNVEKFLIQGLTIQSSLAGAADWYALINIAAGNGTSKDIIIDHNNLSSVDDARNWTRADWLAKTRRGIDLNGRSPVAEPTAGTTCVTITHNMLKNLHNGVALRSDRTLFRYNRLDYIGGDFIDYAANDLVIADNTLTNSNKLDDTQHTDGMQGQANAGPGYSTDMQSFKNLTITGNTVIAQTDKNLKLVNPDFQGISAFDSDWTNVNVSNNTVIPTAYHGISFASVHNGVFANNTVLAGSDKKSWIMIGDVTHEGLPTTNVIVRNNLAHYMAQQTPAAKFENNISYIGFVIFLDGKQKWIRTEGTLPGNKVVNFSFYNNFVKFDNVNKIYDLNLVANSPFKGSGASGVKVNIK